MWEALLKALKDTAFPLMGMQVCDYVRGEGVWRKLTL